MCYRDGGSRSNLYTDTACPATVDVLDCNSDDSFSTAPPRGSYLATHWNTYLEDLLAICRPPSTARVSPLSMGEFLRRNQKLLVEQIGYWHGEVTSGEIERQLGRFRFVAETYGLVIPAASAKRAVADLSILAAMWAVARRGGPG